MAKARSKKPAPAPREPSPSSASISDSDYSSSSDDEIEDEHGAELTPALDAAILRTLAKIKRKEVDVYGGGNVLETELVTAQATAKARGLDKRLEQRAEQKPFLLKDLHRANLLEGIDSEDDEDEAAAGEPLTTVEAERRARADAVSAFKNLANDDDDDEVDSDVDSDAGGLLKKRERDEGEDAVEDEAYRAFLLEMGGGEDAVRAVLGMGDQPVTRYRADTDDEDDGPVGVQQKGSGQSQSKSKSKSGAQTAAVLSQAEQEELDRERRAKRVQADEDFLMDYILNRGWIDKTESHVPTYDEIVSKVKPAERDVSDNDGEEEGSAAAAGKEGQAHPWGEIEDEDEFDELADQFETEYNFRFEEPGSSSILTHPRAIPSLVRRDDDARKLKRAARAERKAAEQAAREEETRRLKGAKRREMEKQLAALKAELGETGVDWAGVEKVLEGEWDEEEWERVVGAMLAAKAEDEDDVKPAWDDDGDYGDYDNGGDAEGEGEVEINDGWVEPVLAWDDDEPINMDADFVDDVPKEGKRKRRKGKGKKGEAGDEATAPGAEVDDATVSVAEKAARIKRAADEYRALDHEDMIGDLRTRFKYTRSAPASFGLSPAEILMATDTELNSIVSVKHIAPYRRGGLGFAGHGIGRRVRELKQTLASRKWGEENEVAEEKAARRAAGPGGANATQLGDGAGKRSTKRLGKKERLRRRAGDGDGNGDGEVSVADDGVTAGTKRKRSEAEADTPAPAAQATAKAGAVTDTVSGEGKKKRRKKKKNATAAAASGGE